MTIEQTIIDGFGWGRFSDEDGNRFIHTGGVYVLPEAKVTEVAGQVMESLGVEIAWVEYQEALAAKLNNTVEIVE